MFVRAKTSFKLMSKEKEELILLEVSLRIIAFKTLNKSQGSPLERVRRVRPYLLKSGNGCAASVLKTVELF